MEKIFVVSTIHCILHIEVSIFGGTISSLYKTDDGREKTSFFNDIFTFFLLFSQYQDAHIAIFGGSVGALTNILNSAKHRQKSFKKQP